MRKITAQNKQKGQVIASSPAAKRWIKKGRGSARTKYPSTVRDLQGDGKLI